MTLTSSQLISSADWSAGILNAINSKRPIPLTAEQEGDALALIRAAWANRFWAVRKRNRTPPPPDRRVIARLIPDLEKAKDAINDQLLESDREGKRELSGAATDAVFDALFRSDTEKDLALFFDHDRRFPKFAKALVDADFVVSAMIKHYNEILARNYHEPPKIRGMHPSRGFVIDLLAAWANINGINVGAVKIGNAQTFATNPFLCFAEAVEKRVEGLHPKFEKAGGRLLKLETIAEYARKVRNHARS